MNDPKNINITDINELALFVAKNEQFVKTSIALIIIDKFMERGNNESKSNDVNAVEILADEVTKVYTAICSAGLDLLKQVVEGIKNDQPPKPK